MDRITRRIEIFSAGCLICERVVREVREAACSSCDIQVLDMNMPDIQKRAVHLGVKSVPAVAIDGTMADCCAGRGVDIDVLRSAGIGQPIA